MVEVLTGLLAIVIIVLLVKTIISIIHGLIFIAVVIVAGYFLILGNIAPTTVLICAICILIIHAMLKSHRKKIEKTRSKHLNSR